MNTTAKFFDMTQLAEASYTRFRDVAVTSTIATEEDLIDKVNRSGNFSAAQAADFVKNWRLVAHQANTGSGFSGSVFERLNPKTGAATGQYTFAFRGTEVGQQFGIDPAVADLGQLVANGAAFDQIIDLYNFVQRVTHADKATIQQAYRVDGATLPASGFFLTTGDSASPSGQRYSSIAFESVSNVKLAGEATIAATTTVDSTGHSLGGHLAVAFSRLFPQMEFKGVSVNNFSKQFTLTPLIVKLLDGNGLPATNDDGSVIGDSIGIEFDALAGGAQDRFIQLRARRVRIAAAPRRERRQISSSGASSRPKVSGEAHRCLTLVAAKCNRGQTLRDRAAP
ncbi:MAG: hypothetical protein ABI583_07085 [Betaproteobacteria bacterium]